MKSKWRKYEEYRDKKGIFKRAMIRFNKSGKNPIDFINLFIATNLTISPKDGLLWSDVNEIASEVIDKKV